MTSVAAPTVVHTRAPGKINVFLAVGDLQDDGYHDLATAYQAVSLYEDVRARHSDDFSVSVTGGPSICRYPSVEPSDAQEVAGLSSTSADVTLVFDSSPMLVAAIPR